MKNVLSHLRLIAILLTCAVLLACDQKSVEFEQVLVGVNGPKVPDAYYFQSRSELDNSWAKSALTPSEYQTLLSRVNFDREILLAFAIGEMETFSGTIKLKSVYLYTGVEGFPINVSAQIGVVGKNCAGRNSVSYPFVLAVLERPKKYELPGGYDIGNFDDGCKRNISGEANDPTIR